MNTPETDAIWKSTLENPSGLDATRIAKTRKLELERNELREALRKAIVWAESAAASITERREKINWSYLEDARRVLSSQNSELNPK